MRNLQVRGRFEPTGRYKYAASVTASLVCRHPARIMLAFRSIDPPALRRGGRPKNNLFDGFNRKASADGSIGKNRRSLQAALRKFRTDTERTVEKQTGRCAQRSPEYRTARFMIDHRERDGRASAVDRRDRCPLWIKFASSPKWHRPRTRCSPRARTCPILGLPVTPGQPCCRWLQEPPSPLDASGWHACHRLRHRAPPV